MSISSTTRKAGPYLGNGATTVFAFAFKVFQASDLKVIQTDNAGVDAVLGLGTHYTVTLNGNQDTAPGGAVTMLSAPVSGSKLTITSDVPIIQPMVLTNSGGFYPGVLNDSADRLTIIAQQMQEQLDRALTIPITTSGVSTEAPKPEANKVLAWNADGSGLENIDASTLATIAAYGTGRIDAFTGDGVTVNFALTNSPGATANLTVTVGGLTQSPTLDYTWAGGTTLTFTTPPPSGARILARYAQALPSGGSVDAGNVVGLQETVEDLIGAALTAGANITINYNDTTGKTTISSTGGGGGGTSNAVNFVTAYGGVGDGVADNNAAIALAEAGPFEVIWLPEGRYVVSTNRDTFTKKYVGPGVLLYPFSYRGAQNAAAYAANVAPTPTTAAYGLNATKMTFTDFDYRVVAPGTRRNFERYHPSGDGSGPSATQYFWAPATPRFSIFENKGGWSGTSGVLSASVSAGATTCNVTGGVSDWAARGLIGQQIGFVDPNAYDGIPSEIVTVTGASGSTLTFTPALANGYAAGWLLSHGYRTMNTHELKEVTHFGGGDAYAWVGRVVGAYTPLASQQTTFQTATVGIIGGDMSFAREGNYGTGWECVYLDNGNDSAVIASVQSFERYNDAAVRGNSVWLNDYAKMDGGGLYYAAYGLKPIDGVYVAAVAARTGLDFTRSRFSVAAVALPLGERIVFDAEGPVAPGPSNGWGFVASETNNMWVRGGSDVGGKFLQLRNQDNYIYMRPTANQFTANTDFGIYTVAMGRLNIWNALGTVTLGSIYGGNDITSNFVDIFAGSTHRLRVRENGTLAWNGTFVANTAINSNGAINAATDLVAAAGSVRAPAGFYINANVYIFWDGSHLRATKNGGASSVIIV
jgi:hypothetical protein